VCEREYVCVYERKGWKERGTERERKREQRKRGTVKEREREGGDSEKERERERERERDGRFYIQRIQPHKREP